MLHQKTFTKKQLIFFGSKFKISTFQTSFTKRKTWRVWKMKSVVPFLQRNVKLHRPYKWVKVGSVAQSPFVCWVLCRCQGRQWHTMVSTHFVCSSPVHLTYKMNSYSLPLKIMQLIIYPKKNHVLYLALHFFLISSFELNSPMSLWIFLTKQKKVLWFIKWTPQRSQHILGKIL